MAWHGSWSFGRWSRAIMRQRETGSRLVLIDEGTSSIDERTEKIVNRIIKENFAGYRGATVDPTRESDFESAEEAT
ncbi:hypothetical protein MY4824_009056 [Beauveria thailandica]